jgi:anaerobic selenocysteine-containing dehydrogenase
VQQPFEKAHFLDGFGWPDGKFRLKADWPKNPYASPAKFGPVHDMPKFPDHWTSIELADETYPFRLTTSPARNFLNSTFTETPTSLAKEERPTVLIHPEDAAEHGICEGDKVEISGLRGRVKLHARIFTGLRTGVLIAESIWPNAAYEDGKGINTLTGADAPAPVGGGAFHDNKVAIRRVEAA